MTIGELYLQVAQLGFSEALEDNNAFYGAVNRALLQICRVKPEVKYCILNHRPLENAVSESTFKPIEKKDEVIFLVNDVKAYYAEADGNGDLFVEKFDTASGEWNILSHRELKSGNGTFVSYKGFIKDGEDFVDGLVRLRFSGNFYYSVKNVAAYQYLISAEEKDIPDYAPYLRYDLKKLAKDFMELCCPPIKEEDNNTILNQNYSVEGDSVILLPISVPGIFKILYSRRPAEVEQTRDAKGDGTIIELDGELCSLLPILVAAYVWIDDEPNISQYYMELYRERVADIERKKTDVSPVAIKNVYGW